VLGLDAAERSARAAYEQAGLRPEDIDVFELHDAFTIYAALALESSGFASRGEGWRLAADGEIVLQGRVPAMTFGGSKARGEAGGATGLYQAAEVVLQLQRRAGENQVPGARIGMAQCLGGAGATAATHIFASLEP
jgi:acetyl-CoA C-acetyltransferase